MPKFFLYILAALLLGGQSNFLAQGESCEFNSYNKKGSAYFFSLYYEISAENPRNGECTMYSGDDIWERRIFKNGIMMSEETSFMNPIRKRTTYFRLVNPKDSIFAEYKEYSETGTLLRLMQYYYNRHGRRGYLETVYDGYQNPRHLSNFVWFYAKEVSDHTSYETPEHTIDPAGYAGELTPIGAEFTYHPNGKLESRKEHAFAFETIAIGEWSLNGPYVVYDEKGLLLQSGSYINGKNHGAWTSYYPDGQVLEKSFYDQGIPVGSWISYHYKTQQTSHTKVYNDDLYQWLIPKEQYFNEKGILTYDKEILLSGKGFEKHFFDDGHLKSAKYYEHGPHEIHSQCEYYENHQLKSWSNLRPQNDTTAVEYFASGQVKMLNLTHHENRDSYWQKVSNYYENGQLKSYSETQHRDGSTEQERFEYYENGTKSMETLYANGQTFEREFYRNGSLKFEKNRIDNFLDGTWLEKDSLGNITKKCRYKDGFRDETCTLSPKPFLPNLNKEEESVITYFLLKACQWNIFSETNSKPEIIEYDELQKRIEVLGVVYRLCSENGWPLLHYDYSKVDTITYTLQGQDYHYNQNKSSFDSLLQAYNFKLITELKEGSYITQKYSNVALFNQTALDSLFISPLAKMNGRIILNYAQSQTDFEFRMKGPVYQETRITLDKKQETYVIKVLTGSKTNTFTIYPDLTIEFYNGLGDWVIDPQLHINELWWD
jgi:antitoxin component YwqK of YwqJK toxin-antitoxin module